MPLPYFYIPVITGKEITLPEETSKHIVQVLRMVKGEELQLTDGRGTKARVVIADDNRKRCIVKVTEITNGEPQVSKVTIAISLIKNAARFEWFLEKATEIGVNHIIPLLCERTEKEKFRKDRLQSILVSAMLQSQQCWMPQLSEPVSFQNLIKEKGDQQGFIAHCLPEEKQQLVSVPLHTSSIILIGPEGDFTEGEIEAALHNGFQPVALGPTRLRTETAGIVAATLLCNGMNVLHS
jgi:16S rRNA (uracil1498-N3)-methyltransferase